MRLTILKSAPPSVRKIAIVATTVAIAAAAALLLGYAGNSFLTFRAEHKGLEATPSLAETPSPSPGAAVIPLLDRPGTVPNVGFAGADGGARSLADFRGKVVLLNIWATWCVPCRREIPSLDRLQAELGGPDFEVIALSIDRGGAEVVREFYDEVGVSGLALYVDDSGQAAPALNVVGLPTTLLIDAEGRELGRLVGPAEWDAPDMIAFLGDVVARQMSAGPERSDPALARPRRAAATRPPSGADVRYAQALTLPLLEALRPLSHKEGPPS